MKRNIRKISVFLKLTVSLAVITGFVLSGQVVYAQASPDPCPAGSGALPDAIFVPWYQYLGSETTEGQCAPVVGDDIPKGVSLIALAVLDTLMRVAGLLATAYLIWGAIQYITSQGDQNGIANAKNTILNAIVGLVITVVAIGLIQFIGNLAR